jgi:cation:H+ antiporter
MIWLEFGLCAVLLIGAATLLSRYGDMLAEKTGLGRVWVGGILLAGVTSLPELVSGVSAVAWLNAPNLAAGAILGSCLFNLALIALMDLYYQPGSILARAQDGHILSGGLGVLLLGLVAVGALLGPDLSGFRLWGFSVLSLAVVVLYLAGARLIARFEQRRLAEVLEQEAVARHYDQVSAVRAYTAFILSTLAVVGLGVWLAYLGDRLSAETGLSRSFVGNLFVAVSTSLPEVAASVAAVRLGAIDLAISNALGSNLFNVALLAVYDVADGRANFWASLSSVNALSAVIAIMMTGVTIVSLMYRASPRTPYRITWDALALLSMYIGTMLLLYWRG